MKGNSVSIKGNVTRDPEVRRTNGGQNLVKFGIAWNKSRRNQNGGYDDVPNYFDVECWASDAQLNAMPKVYKGAAVAIVDGHLEYQSWQDNNGNNRSKVVVVCDDPIQGLVVGAARGQQNGAGGQYQRNAAPNTQQYQSGPQAAPQQPYAYGQGYQQPTIPISGPSQASVYDEDIPF